MGRSKFLLVVASALSLTGCTMAAMSSLQDLPEFFIEEDVNLASVNYAAADYLAGHAHHTLGKASHTIKVGVMRHVNEPETLNAFARLVPEQVGTRLSQLGYVVNLENIQTFEGEIRTKMGKPDVLITGTYLPLRDEVEVYLRLVHLTTGQIIGAYDYRIPKNRQIGALLEPEIQMMVIGESSAEMAQ